MIVAPADGSRPADHFPGLAPARSGVLKRPCRSFLVLLILFGVGLRLSAYVSDRCLWIDEAMLVLNVIERSPSRLIEPLDRNQAAPVGFLMAMKASAALFGPTEPALRLVPLLGSIVGLVAFAVLARRTLAQPAAWLAVALFCVSPHLVSYAAEAKQYATDAAIAIMLVLAATPLPEDQVSSFRRRARLAVMGAIAVWCSHPSLFVLASIGSAWLAFELVRREFKCLIQTSLMILTWLTSFAAVYFVNLRHLGGNSYLTDYWDVHFLPWPPKSGDDLSWPFHQTLDFLRQPGGFIGMWACWAAVVASLGCVALLRNRRSVTLLAFLILPGLFAMAASGVHRYPFGGRLLLFLVPALIYLVALGSMSLVPAVDGFSWPRIVRVSERWSQEPRRISLASISRGASVRRLRSRLHYVLQIVVSVIILAAPCGVLVLEFRQPRRLEELREVLGHVQQSWQPGDRLYVYNGSGETGAGPAFAYYSSRFDFPHDSVILGEVHRADPSLYAKQMEAIAETSGRVWLVFSHRHRDEETQIRRYLECCGATCDNSMIVLRGASGYLYTNVVAGASNPSPLASAP